MISFGDLNPNNKALLCLLLIAFFTALLFLRSVGLREYNLHATYSEGTMQLCEGCTSRYEWHTASTLVFVNNWLQEGAWNLRFALFDVPRSIEFRDFDQRFFYPAYPPGAMLPIYLLFRAINDSGLIPDFANDRSKQLLTVIAYNYLLHLILAVLLCFSVFLILRHINFDYFNATVLACVPALIQFHNAHSMYWHHMLYTFDSAVLLPYMAFVFLELLRMNKVSRPVRMTIQVIQPLLIFYGVFTDWLFLFVALTLYGLRLLYKDIVWPNSLSSSLRFIASSLVFFAPALMALGLWMWQVSYFSEQSFFTTLANNSNQTSNYDLVNALQFRTGIGQHPEGYFHYLKSALYTWLQKGYGLTGVLMIYATFYVVWRGRKLTTSAIKFDRIVVTAYVLLFVPCLLYSVVFLHHAWNHIFSALKFSFALSLSFIVLPLMILSLRGKSPRLVVAQMAGKVDIYAVTALALAGAVFYIYLQIFDRQPLTHFFRKADFKYVVLGDYVRKNSDYEDVLFSNSVQMPIKPPQALSISGKVVYYAHNLDYVHLLVRNIEQDFRVKFLYLQNQTEEIGQLQDFLEQNNLSTTTEEHKRIGGFLSVDGQAFLRWYEQTVPEEERLTNEPS